MTEDEFYDLCESLTERFADRVGDELPVLRSHASGGEWGELVDDLVATLVHNGAAVTTSEWGDLAALVDKMGLELTEPLDRLTVQG